MESCGGHRSEKSWGDTVRVRQDIDDVLLPANILMMNFVDALVVSALVVITGGLDSMVYWVFIVLIVRNAISIPIPVTQISNDETFISE